MNGKTVVLTGATAGIGRIAAERLGEMGARLVLVARDPKKGERVLGALRGKGIAAEMLYADLALVREARRVAEELRRRLPHIDVLVNNAGAIFQERRVTEEGLERTFALNHMGYFALTAGVLDLVKERVVSVASEAHRRSALDFADLQGERAYSGWPAYQRSKLCNILFTRELARRLEGTGVTANCLHPGFVATGFGDNNNMLFRTAIGLAKRFMAISPEEGAKRIVHLATAPEGAAVSGRYFADCRERTPSAAARDDEAARRLWAESERLAGRLQPA